MLNKRKIPLWSWSVILGFGLSFVLAEFVWGGDVKKELFFCWIIHFFNAYTSALINKHAIGKTIDVFFKWALLGHGIRLGIILLLVICAKVSGIGNFYIVGSMTAALYMVNVIIEVIYLKTRIEADNG